MAKSVMENVAADASHKRDMERMSEWIPEAAEALRDAREALRNKSPHLDVLIARIDSLLR